MEQEQVKTLIQNGIKPGIWADLGSGAGAFTLALSNLLREGKIISVDKNPEALGAQKKLFGESDQIEFITVDFTSELTLPRLDGILMANSLHFVKYKDSFIDKLKTYLKPDGNFLVVEYDTDSPNPYVPHPLSFGNLKNLLESKGFEVKLLAHAPSRYQNRMYSALAKIKTAR